jgi:putative hydrolase of the HAD superfamily
MISGAAIAAVLFDLDDTLLDRRATIEKYLAAHAARAGLAQDVARTYRDRFHALDQHGYFPRAQMFAQLCAEFPMIGPSDAMVSDFFAHVWTQCTWFDGAVDILDWCRAAGLKTGIITNGPSPMQRAKLEALDVASRVDTILVSGEEGVSKPDVEIYHRAARRLGVQPEQCLFVGDNPNTDIAGAVAAGMEAVWIECAEPWPSDRAMNALSVANLEALREQLASRLAAA